MKTHIQKIVYLILSFSAHAYSHTSCPPLIDHCTISPQRITVVAHPSLYEHFLKNDFFVQYHDSKLDLTTIDSTVALTPFLLTIAPIIWYSQQSFSIETMDEQVFYTLKKIKKIFKELYPHNTWSGSIRPTKLIKNHRQPKSSHLDLGIMFSGGLDAVCSSFAHATKKQLLITVWGSDVSVHNQSLWQQVKASCHAYIQQYTHAAHHSWVQSNFGIFFNPAALTLLHPITKKHIRWWAHTMQGLGYTGLALPIVYAHGLPYLLIGSTRTHKHPYAYGTHPLIDNHITCAGIHIHHDGAELDRVEKIQSIVTTCKKQSLPLPHVRVCWGAKGQGNNCEQCEKCARTIAELLVAEQDPAAWGFNSNTQQMMDAIHGILKTYPSLSAGLKWHWRCIHKKLQHKKHAVCTENPTLSSLCALCDTYITRYERPLYQTYVYKTLKQRWMYCHMHSAQRLLQQVYNDLPN